MTTKIELINKLRSPDNKRTLQAIEELRIRGWLTDGTLHGIALCNIQLKGADLMQADLVGIDFHQASMEWSDLRNANLKSAKLTRAKLSGANLSQTILDYANLYKANLRGVKNLTEDQLRKVKSLWGAIMPDGKTYDGRYNLPADLALAEWRNIHTSDPKAMAEFYGVSLDEYLEGQKAAAETAAA